MRTLEEIRIKNGTKDLLEDMELTPKELSKELRCEEEKQYKEWIKPSVKNFIKRQILKNK